MPRRSRWMRPASQTGRATSSAPGKVVAVALLDDGAELAFETGRRRVRFLSDDIVEIRSTLGEAFSENVSLAMDPDARFPGPSSLSVDQDESSLLVRSASLAIRIAKGDGRLSSSNAAGHVLFEDVETPSWRMDDEPIPVTTDLTAHLRPGERLLGLGDKAAGIDRRGGRYELWNTDAFGFDRGSDPLYKSIPFVLSIQADGTACGLFVDSFAPAVFDLGREHKDELRIAVETGDLTWYLIHAPTPLEIVERYSSLTGRTPMLPKWALGYHQCRYSYDSEDAMRAVARELRARRIPCDALYYDIHYMDAFRVFTWDRAAFPDPARLNRDLHRDGFATVAIVDPGIGCDHATDPALRSGLERDVFVRHPDGTRFEGPVWPGRCHFPDFFRPDVRAWWGEHVSGLLESGIDGIWCDMNEPSVFAEQVTRGKVSPPERTIDDRVEHRLGASTLPHRQVHNAYGQQMQRATFEGMRRATPQRRPFTITRAAYAGSQRYGTTWTGDNSATWKHLELGLEQLLSLNVSGIPICGTDVGGFSENPTGELMVRWTQAGVLSPLFRNHSSVDTPRQEPWLFGRKVEVACREAIELRYRLLPYLYTQLRRAATMGTPILRPLELMHPEDPHAAKLESPGLYLGDALIAFPVVRARRRTVRAYLPEVPGGWFDFHTGERLPPGRHRVEAPLSRLPLFVRAGTVLPLGPVVQSTAELGTQPITLRVYPLDGSFESSLYEDASDGWDHEKDQFLHCTFRGEGSGGELVLATLLEGSFPAPWSEVHLEVMGRDRAVQTLLVDGREAGFEQDRGMISSTVPFGASIEIR